MDEPNDKDVVAPLKIEALRYFDRLTPLFSRLHEVGCERDTAGNRTLFMDDYCQLVVLYLFNPMIDSLAMLRAAVKLPKVAKVLGVKSFSAGSFSESVRVFDPGRMMGIVVDLAGDCRVVAKGKGLLV